MNVPTWLRPLARGAAWLFFARRKLIYSAPLADLRDTAPRIPVEFRFAAREDLLALDASEYGYSPEARAFSLQRMNAGDRLVLGIAAGKVVYFGWLMFGQMDLGLGDYRPVSGRSIYAYKLFTHAGFRGNRICPAFYTFLKRHFTGQAGRVVCWVEASNAASIRTHSSAGLRHTGSYWQIQFCGRNLFFIDEAAKRMGVSRQADSLIAAREVA